MDEAEPRLLGARCAGCGTYVFPKGRLACPNPGCESTDLDDVPLGRRGTVWSWTVNRYQPPPPYVAPDPFEPYAVAAVGLPNEGLVVLGQVDGDADGVRVGAEVELVLGPLFEDDEAEYVVWKWRPVDAR
jgi:uncharacterized OB-fold protein